ncbi:MAG: VWA domain-containing protein [Euryarchaeota archaeon]|nr:VWA domain-containing protein [Euryarchaeota archaeon]
MKLIVPDCREHLDAFFLTPEQRREILLLLAEKGEAGIAEFVRRYSEGDPKFAKRLARIREQLLREAEELRRRLHSDYDLRRQDELARSDAILRKLRDEQQRLESEKRRLDLELPEAIRRRVLDLPIIQIATAPPEKLPWWRRAYNWVWRLFRSIWIGLLRLLGRRGAMPRPKALVIGVHGLGGPGLELNLDLETALRANPDLRRRIRRGMGETFAARTRRMWRIILGMENYAEVAKEILEQQAKAAAQDQAGALRNEQERITAALAKDEKEQAAQERLLRDEISRLDAAEAEEERRLRETLSHRPAEELRHLVTAELEAAGLVEKLAGRLRLTGRFLDTFAALVYTEEARGVAPTRESALGTSIEGEGILERTRLLSHAEASHMDTVSTLVNARTNHPHIRHLVEEDVVVYREQRATQTHIVIVMDQSLSMEENDRIVAAKRAALALYYQTRRKGSRHKIDFVLMETSVRRATLAEVWDAKPKGFTNVGRALQVANELLSASRANRKILFLVTDGLPEAVTIEGKDVAAKPDEALAYALRQADRLRRLPGLSMSLVLLEARDPLFVAAAEKIAKRARGRVTKVEPQELVKSLLVQVRQDELLAR